MILRTRLATRDADVVVLSDDDPQLKDPAASRPSALCVAGVVVPNGGVADSLDEAKAAFRAAWKLGRSTLSLSPHDVRYRREVWEMLAVATIMAENCTAQRKKPCANS
jgi:hypothetical protein